MERCVDINFVLIPRACDLRLTRSRTIAARSKSLAVRDAFLVGAAGAPRPRRRPSGDSSPSAAKAINELWGDDLVEAAVHRIANRQGADKPSKKVEGDVAKPATNADA